MKRTPLSRGTKQMKRSGFKQSPTKPLAKRSKLTVKALKPRKATSSSKPKQKTVKQLKSQLWELCKQIIRKRYQKEDGTWTCYTCGRLIDSPAKAQTGHGIPSSTGGVLLRYHLNNLRIQDYFCNINLGGHGGEFYIRLVKEIGQEEVDKIYALKNQTAKADVLFFEQKIAEYSTLLAGL